jgi:hypothetical protein
MIYKDIKYDNQRVIFGINLLPVLERILLLLGDKMLRLGETTLHLDLNSPLIANDYFLFSVFNSFTTTECFNTSLASALVLSI